ncbi:hypothetical protein GQ53DRAFT_603112, partial [Thozetella sp. PMI_491]
SALALATLASAQTFTKCDPTKTDCPPDAALGATIKTVDFRKGKDDFFEIADGTTLTYDGTNGAVFSIANVNQAPTITSSKYIFFGKVDVVVKASLGVGVVTSVTLQSDDLDEIDWEWLGGDSTQVQTNFFSKGCTEVYDRGGYSAVANPQADFHTYTIDWTPDSVKWIIDGAVVRELKASTASGCDGFPQTPMQIKLGTWIAGKPGNPQGTIDWAGGITDFSQGPFLGYYQSVTIQDYMGGSGATAAGEYVYGDKSGTWQSIKVNGGSSSGSSSSASSSAAASSTTSKSSTSEAASKTSSATTLTSVTSAASNGTATTTSAGSSGTSGSQTTSATTSAVTTTGKNAAGKVAGSLFLAGAGLVAALLL